MTDDALFSAVHPEIGLSPMKLSLQNNSPKHTIVSVPLRSFPLVIHVTNSTVLPRYATSWGIIHTSTSIHH